MSDFIYQPYTYLIGWSNQNTYYYGVRYASKCTPSELWESYFTSSNYVKRFIKLYGNPDIIQIRKIFPDADKARLWEHKVLRRLNVVNDDRFLNQSDNISISAEAALTGARKKKSASMKQKIAEYRTGRVIPQRVRKAISRTKKGVPLSEEERLNRKRAMNDPLVKKKLSDIGKTKVGDLNNFYGKSHSEETRKKISDSKRNSVPINRKSVVIDGIEYESIKQAHIMTGISKHLIRKLLKTDYL